MAETGEEETASAEASGFSDLSDSELVEFLDLEEAKESAVSLSKPGPSAELPGKDDKPVSLQNWKGGLVLVTHGEIPPEIFICH